MLISKDNCRFSSYDIGLALSSSSESKADTTGTWAFLRPGPAPPAAAPLPVLARFAAGPPAAPPDGAAEPGFGPLRPEINKIGNQNYSETC